PCARRRPDLRQLQPMERFPGFPPLQSGPRARHAVVPRHRALPDEPRAPLSPAQHGRAQRGGRIVTFSIARAALLGLSLVLFAPAGFAQESAVPFDMSGERPAGDRTPEAGGNEPVVTTMPEKKASSADAAVRRYIIPAASLLLG